MASQQKVDQLIADFQGQIAGADLASVRQRLLDPNVPDSQLDTYRQWLNQSAGAETVQRISSDAYTYPLAAQSRELNVRLQAATTPTPGDPGVFASRGNVTSRDLGPLRSWLNSVPADRRAGIVQHLEQVWDSANLYGESGSQAVSDLVAAGRDYNFWHLMNDQERSQYLPKDSGALVDQIAKGVGGLTAWKGLNLGPLKAALSQLTGADLWRATQQLTNLPWDQVSIGGDQGLGQLQGMVNRAVTQLSSSYPQTAAAAQAVRQGRPAPPPASAQAQPAVQTTAPGAAPTAAPALPGDITAEEKQYLSSMLGMDWQTFYNNFSQHYVIASTSAAPAGSILPAGAGVGPYGAATAGTTPGQPAANAPINASGQTAGSPALRAAAPYEIAQLGQVQPGKAATPAEVAHFLLDSLYGLSYHLASVAADYYQATFNAPMPAEARAQVMAIINGMSDSEKQVLLLQVNAAGGDPTKLQGVLPSGITTYLYQYSTAHPSQSQEDQQAAAALRTQFMNTLGRAPNEAETQQLLHADQQTILNYIDSAASSVGGLSYGQLSHLRSTWNSQWQDYYHRDPTNAEYQWMATATPEQIQQHIDNSPSSLPDVTVGRYKQLKTYTDSITPSLWRYHGGDDLIQAVHQATSA